MTAETTSGYIKIGNGSLELLWMLELGASFFRLPITLSTVSRIRRSCRRSRNPLSLILFRNTAESVSVVDGVAGLSGLA